MLLLERDELVVQPVELLVRDLGVVEDVVAVAVVVEQPAELGRTRFDVGGGGPGAHFNDRIRGRSRQNARVRRLAFLLPLLAFVVGGCGGDDAAETTAGTGATPPAVTVTAPKETAQASPRPTGKPTFTVTLTAASHTPRVGQNWRFVVRARDRRGRPVGGTAKMRVFVGNQLVDTIGFFAFDGTLTRTHKWPPVLRGKKGVVLQAEVEGEGGTQRVNWPVTVR